MIRGSWKQSAIWRDNLPATRELHRAGGRRKERPPADAAEITLAAITARHAAQRLFRRPVIETYELIRAYTERRVRRWLMRRTGRRGVGFRQVPDEYLYETLGLYSVPRRRVDLPRSKV